MNCYGQILQTKTSSLYTTNNMIILERNKYLICYDRIINLQRKELIYSVLRMIYRLWLGVESRSWRDLMWENQ